MKAIQLGTRIVGSNEKFRDIYAQPKDPEDGLLYLSYS